MTLVNIGNDCWDIILRMKHDLDYKKHCSMLLDRLNNWFGQRHLIDSIIVLVGYKDEENYRHRFFISPDLNINNYIGMPHNWEVKKISYSILNKDCIIEHRSNTKSGLLYYDEFKMIKR